MGQAYEEELRSVVAPMSRIGPVVPHRTTLPRLGEAMSTSTPSTKNGIASSAENIAQRVSGPHWEPAAIPNATIYWRCECCGYESIHKRDLHCESFHAQDCEGRQ